MKVIIIIEGIMKNFTFLLFAFALSFPNLFGQSVFTVEKPDQNGCAYINGEASHKEGIYLPQYDVQARENHSIFLRNAPAMVKGGLVNDVIKSSAAKLALPPAGHFVFELDTRAESIAPIDPTTQICDKAKQAILEAPLWLEDQLTLKLQLLAKSSYDDDFAQLILDAPQKMKDEVAFFIAYTSFETLTDPRFISDKEMIIRNAEMIYNVDDSLQYVDIVEHDAQDRNYYTTTKYRIYDPQKQDTIWSEIPREMYYFYIVCAKMDQEGVYVKDNSGVAEQRTWGIEWRKYIWENPDPAHDYTQVNKTTSKGSIITIPRFADVMKKPRILWNRTKTYYPFNRPFEDDDHALDVLGNWASRALPVDVTLPRSFQPNQILMKHDGMCNEDAFLVTAACRTALIPTIYLGTWSEDHVFSAIWDGDWHHYEFFRGGLQPNAPDAFGITNMTERGSYGWKNAYVDGFRPDGFPLNFTKYYADTCQFIIKVTDSLGNPMEGAMLTFYASNTYNAQSYLPAGKVWTDANGVAKITVGANKRYRIQASHPKYGTNPPDANQVFILLNSATAVNRVYTVALPYSHIKMKNSAPASDALPESGAYGFHARWSVRDILSGANPHDSQRSRFYFWNDSSKGEISFFVCDSANYEKFRKNQDYTAYEFNRLTSGGDVVYALPGEGKWYVVFSNKDFASYYQFLDMSVDLTRDALSARDAQATNREITIAPNPASHSFKLDGYEGECEAFNALGVPVWKGVIHADESVDVSSFANGIYYLRTGGKMTRFAVVR